MSCCFCNKDCTDGERLDLIAVSQETSEWTSGNTRTRTNTYHGEPVPLSLFICSDCISKRKRAERIDSLWAAVKSALVCVACTILAFVLMGVDQDEVATLFFLGALVAFISMGYLLVTSIVPARMDTLALFLAQIKKTVLPTRRPDKNMVYTWAQWEGIKFRAQYKIPKRE